MFVSMIWWISPIHEHVAAFQFAFVPLTEIISLFIAIKYGMNYREGHDDGDDSSWFIKQAVHAPSPSLHELPWKENHICSKNSCKT